MTFQRPWVLHPFFLAAFPVLSLAASNMQDVSCAIVTRPLAATLGFALVAWVALRLGFRNGRKAGILVSVLVMLVFSYGHLVRCLGGLAFHVGGLTIGPNKMLIPLYGAIFLACTLFLIRTRKPLDKLTSAFNVAAAALIAVALLRIGTAALGLRAWDRNPASSAIETPPLTREQRAALPDIYYVILDAYGRQDVLAAQYQHSNQDFIGYLKEKGFFVASKSCSNYGNTIQSTSSALNFGYLPVLLDQVRADFPHAGPIRTLLRNSRILQSLRHYGYTFIAFASGYGATEFTNADIYMSSGWALSEFEHGLLSTTCVPAITAPLTRARHVNWLSSYEQHRKAVLSILDRLGSEPPVSGPVFVFAHIMCPHPPFVFGPSGEPIEPPWPFSIEDCDGWLEQSGATREGYRSGYRDQVVFLNRKLRDAIDSILSHPTRPRIIILQGDHGPGSDVVRDVAKADVRERFGIFNAYLLPGDGRRLLYDSISPVNTFRVILNHYFGTHYERLDDRSYAVADYEHRPFEFIDVTQRARQCLPSSGSPPR